MKLASGPMPSFTRAIRFWRDLERISDGCGVGPWLCDGRGDGTADSFPSLFSMKVNLNIEYEVAAEAGETQAEEDRVMESVKGMVEKFAANLVESAKAEGLTVNVAR